MLSVCDHAAGSLVQAEGEFFRNPIAPTALPRHGDVAVPHGHVVTPERPSTGPVRPCRARG